VQKLEGQLAKIELKKWVSKQRFVSLPEKDVDASRIASMNSRLKQESKKSKSLLI
jgi:hypothetical protein